MMQTLIEQLIEILQRTGNGYQQLLPLIAKEKEMVRKADIGALGDIATEKEHLLINIKMLDNKRGYLLNQIAGELRFPGETLTLRELIRHIAPQQGERLRQIRETLKSLLTDVRSANNANRALMHHCLGLVRQAMSTMSPKTVASSVYQATGSMIQGESGGRLVSNTA
jgi:flagellar biosynthesis/type III secretory pathway chaperone